ncbi:MAG: ATP-binding protein [Bacteroidaceae bacterium]|nr:ATP-binding protein [Bacteroidaceae bacterium]
MENFFQRHTYLVEQTDTKLIRSLMNEIDWSHRMIGIKGPRGVGKTTFLLQYAKLNFNPQLERCLYINMDSFYFQGSGIVEFAEEFVKRGGRTLIIDQAYKQTGWRDMLCLCYHKFPQLHIIYNTTTVEKPNMEFHELSQISHDYVLHGFSFREYINLQTQESLPRISLDDILLHPEQAQKNILMKVRPWNYLQNYLHHGYYPFYMENHNFTESLLKNLNAMLEVDILFIKQIDVKYLSRLKQLLYLLATGCSGSPNISNLAKAVQTSRATVMNYINALEEARLIHQIFKSNGVAPKKPARILMHNTNLLYGILNEVPSEQDVMETFFTNSIWRHHMVEISKKPGVFTIDKNRQICVCSKNAKRRKEPGVIYARYNTEVGHDNDIPIWLFGFLY